MRTRPLPNRHAHDLSLFAETIQATLNKPRNRSKGPLEGMSFHQLLEKDEEESDEMYWAVRRLEKLLEQEDADPDDIQRACADVEHEAADLAVCALAAFIKARGLGNG